MNIIGEIGVFITTYQYEIQVAAAVCLVILGVVYIGKAVASSRKRQKKLTQIHETVLEINSNVKRLGEKKTEVIYIDGRITPEAYTETLPERPEQAKATTETARRECMPPNQEKNPGGESHPIVKYFSRDCAVAKDGKKYTREELNVQIRD